jgi:hypothetical protein
MEKISSYPQILDVEMASMGNRMFKNTSLAFTILASLLFMFGLAFFLGKQNAKMSVSCLH